MTRDEIQKIVEARILKNPRQKDGNQYISMKNSSLDFSWEFIYQGVTKSGRVKLGEVTGWADGKATNIINRFAKVRDNACNPGQCLWVNCGGSHFYMEI